MQQKGWHTVDNEDIPLDVLCNKKKCMSQLGLELGIEWTF